jgi:hypothetical protein
LEESRIILNHDVGYIDESHSDGKQTKNKNNYFGGKFRSSEDISDTLL